MNKAICLYVLLGLVAGALFSSCICGTDRKFQKEDDCNFWDNTATSFNSISRTICNGFLILAINFLYYLVSRCVDYRSTAAYTMLMPFWMAFTLSLTYMSDLSFS
ncbi:hypothetical protein L6164_026220 [Bauhinia variegata]|uniref:Uncharacterized protein n=1 Tax=Bauhinia variegata TaxID=167791 RepID=A0ACB9LQF2_BAUVA|nr:hypothetical protein L6164_026220 [Bauhinia variegata]